MNKYILLILLISLPLSIRGQWYGALDGGFASDVDITTLSALYQDYDINGRLLKGRAATELVNNEIHKGVVAVTEEYSDQALAVDKYLHALDVLDVVWNGVKTAFHAKDVYDEIKQTVKDYGQLLDEYKRLVLDNPAVHPSPADLQIIDIARSAASDVLDECSYIWDSYKSLALYIVPVPGVDSTISVCRIKPTDLSWFLERTNASMDRIATRLRTAYRATRTYLLARFGYFKEEIHIAYTKHQKDSIKHWIDSTALERWKAIPDTVVARQNRQKQNSHK